MPRGVAVPEPRQQLFAAAERVVARDGLSRLTSRAVTAEAGVATGLLFKHFTNFDKFLTGYAVDRAFQITASVAGLPGRAGSGTVGGTLSEALLATPMDTLQALIRVMADRPGLTAAVEAVLGAGSAGLAPLEHAAAGYLRAEQHLGRLPAAADTGALALAAVGALTHIALTAPADPGRLYRVMDALTAAPDRQAPVRARRSG
ncbi:TetR family transcriptional regulator [Actinoplanes sp. DH11]|uniref:TetR family transcriptional regulator n=1 Tax=Actinoplanes sp. DH11 TaxID=2857011 RepID=UPI001E35D58E|nr:TetR family transcriptional regulator [Actinoplanes sp. DH11]